MKKRFTFILSMLLASTTFVAAQENEEDEEGWKISGENTFLLNQSSFTNWASGGENTFAGNLIFNYDFNYKKDKWSWDNKVLASYGQTFQKETDWRKNDDRLELNSLAGYQASEYWLYTFFMNFKTQFAKGYDYISNTEKRTISDFIAPAYLSFGPGFAYKKDDNFKVNISPAASRFVFVTIDSLAPAYSIDEGKNSRFEFGASLDAYYKTDIMENVSFENTLRLYSNYLDNPKNVDVDYTANIFMTVNEYITVNAGVQLIYDDNILINKIVDGVDTGHKRPTLQVKQILGAGFTYKF